MKRVEYAQKRTTPYILVDTSAGLIKLEGRSSPENAREFYSPILDALSSGAFDDTTITIDFKIEYMNTSSTKCIFMIFSRLGKLHSDGVEVNVNWYSEEDDYDLIETGEDFEELSEIAFNYILI